MDRREYSLSLKVNGIEITKVVIDPHFEKKHSGSVSDEVILCLVMSLSGKAFEPDEVDPPYVYFVEDKVPFKGKKYKLVWLLEDQQQYLGVVNAYRR